MSLIPRNPEVTQMRAETKGGGSIPPSHTSGFSWRTILIGVALIALVVLAVAFGLPALFAR